MKQPLVHLLLILGIICTHAVPASASGVWKADGYSLRLPPGFEQAQAKRVAGGSRLRARFGRMPLDGAPDVQAFVTGAAERPAATLLLGRMDLKQAIYTHQELGSRQIEAMDARVSEGFDFKPLKIGTYDAIQMEFSSEVDGEPRSTRVLSVACGPYLVVMLLDTADERYRGADATWADLVATLKIVPRSQRLLTLGLYVLGGMLALGIVLRLSRRLGSGGATQRRRQESGLVLPGSGGAPYAEPQGRYRGSAVRRPHRPTPPTRKGLLNTLTDNKRK